MPEIAPKEKSAKSSLTAFQAFFGKPCCRQTKYNSTGPKTRSKCEGQANTPRSRGRAAVGGFPGSRGGAASGRLGGLGGEGLASGAKPPKHWFGRPHFLDWARIPS